VLWTPAIAEALARIATIAKRSARRRGNRMTRLLTALE
jgi:hypothetical protein